MTEQPRFQPGEQAVVTLAGVDQPCHILGREPGEHARGFHGTPWVYHVVPAGCDFGVNVPESAVRPANS